MEILNSLASDWEYASLIRQKLESGDISSEQITELRSILWGSIQKIDNEKERLEMENVLFRKFLIQTQEAGTRKSENATIDSLLIGL